MCYGGEGEWRGGWKCGEGEIERGEIFWVRIGPWLRLSLSSMGRLAGPGRVCELLD